MPRSASVICISAGTHISDVNTYLTSAVRYGVIQSRGRFLDLKSQEWSIWWLDGRSPRGPLDPPVRGRFHDGIGTFHADDTFEGRPIRVRYVWSHITAASCRWEQAFSPDGGRTWELNWIMQFTRVP